MTTRSSSHGRDLLVTLALVLLAPAACVRSGHSVAPRSDATSPSDAGGGDSLGDGAIAPLWLPSNIGDRILVDQGKTTLTVGTDAFAFWVADTTDGSITAYQADFTAAKSKTVREAGTGDKGGIVFSQLSLAGAASGIGVWSVHKLELLPSGMLIGVGSRPMVIVAADQIVVDGRITVSAGAIPNKLQPGAGGGEGGGPGRVGSGPGGGAAGQGGGGGSHGGLGGKGGDGAAAGKTYGQTTIVPLLGGSGGGGTNLGTTPARGGHAGGALQLVAGVRIAIDTTGIIDACGEGGKVAPAASGGGSGGAILLEAPKVQIAGFIGANGGGGGGITESGQNGSAVQVPALGGSRTSTNSGGSGSDANGVATAGHASGGCCPGGGGGGGAGRIRINTATGTESYNQGITPTVATSFSTVGTVQPPR